MPCKSVDAYCKNDDAFIESIRLENFDFYSPWGFEKDPSRRQKILMNCSTSRCRDRRANALHQLGAGTTRIFAIMPPSSCSRIWQWYTNSPSWENGMFITVGGEEHWPLRH